MSVTTLGPRTTFPFAVAFPDYAYSVSLQLTRGFGDTYPTVINKTKYDFTIDEQAGGGGNTYDVTVIHD